MSFTFSDLRGKAFAVTGAASGMGKAISLLLAEQGANVGLIDLQRPQGVADAIAKIPDGGKSIPLSADVTKPDQVDAAIQAIVQEFGRLDGAANMAGIVGDKKIGDTGYAIEAVKDSDWDLMMDINLNGVKNSLRAELSHMKGPGSIVNAASMAGQQANPYAVPYATTKWGVIGLTKGVAGEVGPKGIRVNAIAPGIVKTPLTETLGQQTMADLFMARISLGRLAEAEDVAKVVVFLLSDVAGYISASVVNVDGGWL